MQLKIFDVSHGFCAYLVADNGNIMLFDCGHNEESGFRPSEYLPAIGCRGIEHLFISNFDQDHVSDLHNVLARLPVTRFFRNQTLTHEQIRAIKLESGPLSTAMAAAIEMHKDYIHPVTEPPEFPDIVFATFHNSYPAFADTNNLSLVTFITYDGFGIVFPGDLEKAGWMELLKDSLFRDYLSKTRVFVASHHGRISGYCSDVFKYCKPDIVIISDKEIVHDTQEQNYRSHASGVPWDGGPDRRYVLTTRSDGMITITKTLGEGYHIQI